MGPFLSRYFSLEQAKQNILKNGLTLDEFPQLEHFYQCLTILTTKEIQQLGLLIFNLVQQPLLSPSINQQKTLHIVSALKELSPRNTLEKEQIVQNYHYQKQMMQAISQGKDPNFFLSIVNNRSFFQLFENRVPGNQLRSSKNIALSFNTSCRIAAEKGGVHPFYLHETSEKYAVLIERIHSLIEIPDLLTALASEYCQLVRQLSINQYSPTVGRIIQYIQLHLTSNLSLKTIAAALGSNASYLSRLFKEETGKNMTFYINEQRIQAAESYLEISQTNVTKIAFVVGYNNVS